MRKGGVLAPAGLDFEERTKVRGRPGFGIADRCLSSEQQECSGQWSGSIVTHAAAPEYLHSSISIT
jgi:hypothetical protein